jgi:exodeoxyribonuclease-1
MTDPTLYWHDYETFGLNPGFDRPAQFAGIRTDADFNIIDKPLVVYCKPATDTLPEPTSCLITGITPQLTEQKGLCEADFISRIHAQLAQPNTCTLGYNNLRFDDEVTRHCLYRNFYDAYAREWQQGNSRWDLLDVVRATKALRPDGIHWPMDEEGKPTFRLDQLTLANNIPHEGAHDALVDVYATIAIARLIKDKQPKLYQFLWRHRGKHEALNLLQLGAFRPVVHVSGKYPAVRHCLAIVLPICKHPTDSNGVIVYDLSVDPEPLLTLSAEDIQQRLFTASDDLPAGVARIPLKTVHINKCPVLAPVSVIRDSDAQRLAIDLTDCYANLGKIKAVAGLSAKLAVVFKRTDFVKKSADPDLALYSGGFFADYDKQQMAKIRAAAPEQLADIPLNFKDARLPEMLFRYRARNYPETLTPEEAARWKAFCVRRLTDGEGITLKAYFAQLQALQDSGHTKTEIIESLDKYARSKMLYLGMGDDVQ